MIFRAAKVQRYVKTDKSVSLHLFNLSYCYFRDSKTMSLFITNKKKREKAQKISYFLLKSFADSEKSSTFASQSRNNKITSKQRNPVIYLYCVFFDLFTFSVIKSILYICALLSYHITYYV